MLHIDKELYKLMIARGDFERLAYVMDSLEYCRIVAIDYTAYEPREAGQRPSPVRASCEVIGEGATTAEALASAYRNSATVIAEAAKKFRASRKPPLVEGTAATMRKMIAVKQRAK